MLSFIALAFVLSARFVRVVSFSFGSRGGTGAPMIDNGAGRRQFLSGIFVATSAAVVAVEPSFADVSDGNVLPKGAAQFSRAYNIKSDLLAVGKRVTEHSSEIDAQEWDNIGGFLRKLYQVGEDMKAIANGISDPEKKKKALEDAKLIQKYAQAGDLPVSKQDASRFLVIYRQELQLIDEFFGLLQDVPDEI